MEKEPLEILVVDDKEENLKAAIEYFSTKSNISVISAKSYEEAMQKLQEKVYAVGLFDLELPVKEGAEPEELGFKLVDEAEKYKMPWAVITSGIDHHQCKSAFVCFPWMSEREAVEFDRISGCKLTEAPKTSPESWKRIYEVIEDMYPLLEELTNSRKRRYKKR